MKQVENQIQKQLAKPLTWFVKYYPVRIKNIGRQEMADRQLVWDFKDGKAFEEVAQGVAMYIIGHFTTCNKLTFVCLPASSAAKNEKRYCDFSRRVCELTGMQNGFNHIQVKGERLSIHEHRNIEKEIRKVSIVSVDNDFFYGKQVILFDDIITTGVSFANFANYLESVGAQVLEGIFMGHTDYKPTK